MAMSRLRGRERVQLVLDSARASLHFLPRVLYSTAEKKVAAANDNLANSSLLLMSHFYDYLAKETFRYCVSCIKQSKRAKLQAKSRGSPMAIRSVIRIAI